MGFTDWAAQQGARLVELSRAGPLRATFDVIVDGRSVPMTAELHQRGISVAEVEGLTLLRGFIPVAANGTYIEGTLQDRPDAQLPGIGAVGERSILVEEAAAEETIDEPCLVLCGFPMHYRNYFHAVAQNFIRLPLVLQEPEFAGLRIAVSERIRSWGMDFLAAIGISQDRLIYVKQDRSTMIRRAFLPSPPNRIGLPSVAEVRALRDALFDGSVPEDGQDRLFVARDAVAKLRRMLANEPELQEIAVQNGYQLVDPVRMSIRGQIEAFSRASAICGATGAGLTNLLYAPSGSAVVCFSPRESCRSFFLHLSAVAGQRFTWCLGAFLPEVRSSGQFPQLPYEVDTADFQALFEARE